MTSKTWSADETVNPPIYRNGIWRFQAHGPVLLVMAFVWGSLLVRALNPVPLRVPYDTPLGAVFLFAAAFAALVSLFEMTQWLRALLPSRWGGKAFTMGVVETLCATGLALHAWF